MLSSLLESIRCAPAEWFRSLVAVLVAVDSVVKASISEQRSHFSDSGECWTSGGYWIEGTVYDSSWLSIDVNKGIVSGFGLGANGLEYSVGGAAGSNPWGAWVQTWTVDTTALWQLQIESVDLLIANIPHY